MTTICIEFIEALAGFVPCAEAGMRQTLRWWSPRDLWYARMAISPVYSPEAPELGCSDTASKPVISHSISLSSANIVV